jgi:predicted ATPase/DNA-binding winged helix-turn-helix (wHTH) protein
MTELATTPQDLLSFGPFSLAASTRLLTRDGVEVNLSSRALDLLLRLVARPNQPIGKRELLAEVWPDQTVGEASLRFHMANLRKALGDGRDGARYITTLSGRGYCFVAPLSRAAPEAARTIGNLPPRPPLIGRDGDLAEVTELLGHERLVTIVGPGGVGKTRLAIAAGQRLGESLPDGAWLVDLAPLSEPSQVVSAVATALDLTRGGSQISEALIVSALKERRLLLILDNCEYLVGAAAELAGALVEGIPGLAVLATSQEALRIDAERVYRLDPLDLPPPDAINVAGYGAVDLFTHRARAADRRFELNEANAVVVADICRSLDGMPLSLEMAAARAPSLGIEGLRASLAARLQMLSAGLRTSDARHRTLRGTAEWSVGLLDDTEALVFRRLGIFSGGFSLEAAMAVAADGQLNAWSVADTVARLVDKSIVKLERRDPTRYGMLETLRLYARELLQAGGEWDALAKSHALYFCRVFAPAREAWQRTPVPAWQSIYMPELDNLRSALDWVLADPTRRDLAFALTASTGFIWYEWGLFDEGRRLLTRIEKALDDRVPSVAAAAILLDTGTIFRDAEEYGEAQRKFARAAAISRQAGDDLGLALANLALASVGMVAAEQYSEMAALLDGVRETLSARGQKRSLVAVMTSLGLLATYEGRFEAAVEDHTLATELARQLKDERREQGAVSNLALAEFSRGDIERAIEIGRVSVSVSRSLAARHYLAINLENLASYLVAAGRLSDARPVAEEALSLVPVRAESTVLLRHLQQWALIAALEGQCPDAARLIGWVDADYERRNVTRNQWEATGYKRLLSKLRSQLSDAELSTLAAEGARWDAERAVSFTFECIVHDDGEVVASLRG